MPGTEQIYRRTEAGISAYENQNSGLSTQHRSILGLIEGDTHSDLVRKTFRRRYGDKQIHDWLNELQALGFLESKPVTATHDLDFTGSLNLADLQARQKAA